VQNIQWHGLSTLIDVIAIILGFHNEQLLFTHEKHSIKIIYKLYNLYKYLNYTIKQYFKIAAQLESIHVL